MHLPRLWELIVIVAVALVVIGLVVRARKSKGGGDR